MNYTIKLPRGETLNVDEKTGENIKSSLTSGDTDRMFQVGKSMYPMKDVRGVIAQDDSRLPDYVRENEEALKMFEVNLARFSREGVLDKVKRELRYRIKPGLKGEPVQGWQEVANTLGRFFRENPKYPWCPLTEWVHKVFPVGCQNIPAFYQAVVRHDHRVSEWVGENKPQEVVDILQIFDGTALGGGDLDA